MPASTRQHYSHALALLVPPEVYFEPQESLSFPADIWTLAWTIWEIIGQRPLFEGFNPSADWVIRKQVDALGKLPLQWWLKWDSRMRWFNEDGTRHSDVNPRTWEPRFSDSVQEPRQEAKIQEVGEEEKVALLAMLRAMLAFQPEERLLSTGRLLAYNVFGALMVYYDLSGLAGYSMFKSNALTPTGGRI